MFFVIVLSVWAMLHLYVGWRLASIPWVAAHIGPQAITIALVLLWLSFPTARLLSARGFHSVASPLELLGSTWVGVFFLLFTGVLLAEALTLGGWVLPALAPQLRGWGALLGLALAGTAFVQGLRPPAVHEYEIALPGLPRERDGTSVVVLSDLHLGSRIGADWLTARLAQVEALKPDLILIAGDLVDSDLDGATALQPLLGQLHAPLGVWLVLGNHDVYAGTERVCRFAAGAGIGVLRNRTVELTPGLRLAGIDDPATLRRTAGHDDRRLATALADEPRGGATILLAHTPDSSTADAAAAAGIGLMLSGHTHGGQIWPFSYLVRQRFPLFVGRYQIGEMTVLVSRGTGTWGPRMRLWQPGEILHLRLRSDASTT